MSPVLARWLAAALSLAVIVGAVPSEPRGDAAVHILRVSDGDEDRIAGLAERLGADDVQVLDELDLVVARTAPRVVARLHLDPAVRSVAADVAVRALDGGARDLDDDDDQEGAKRSGTKRPGVGAIAIGARGVSATGRGVTVALLDSGVAVHPDLGSRVLARVDFVRDGSTRHDPGGHGTHLAGVIAGRVLDDDDLRIAVGGVAPSARIVSLRVLDASGTGRLTGVLAAFQWVLKNRSTYRISVLNASFGMPQRTSYHDDVLASAVEAAWFAGITVVTAAGNAGPALGTITTPGSDPFVITVGSFDDQASRELSDDRESPFSARGPTIDGVRKPDVLAPGRRVVSLRSAGSSLDVRYPERRMGPGHARMSGTSVAAAMVAGLAALVIERNPGYRPHQVKAAIVAGARAVTESPRRGAWAPTALSATGTANAGLRPSRTLLRLLDAQLAGSSAAWESAAWESVNWDSVAWESVGWESPAWESPAWESPAWETLGSLAR